MATDLISTIDTEAWQAWFRTARELFERDLATHVESLTAADPHYDRLLDAVSYSLTQGGKRLRPILTIEACRACGGKDHYSRYPALAVECIHTFSLIHDDLPAMDDDDLRRGQPTNHKVFGEAIAILAGDWLVAHAFEMLAHPDLPPPMVPRLVRALGHGSRAMVAGQASDIAGETQATTPALVKHIHRHKTASLIEACCRLGAAAALSCEADEVALGTFGQRLGLAFQIIDDILDCTASTEQLGKTAGKDAAVDKQTYPAAFGLDASRVRAREEIDAALAAIEPFGDRGRNLRGMAHFVIARDR